jgi:hypothetical protein
LPIPRSVDLGFLKFDLSKVGGYSSISFPNIFVLFGISGVFGIRATDVRADTGVCPYAWLPSFREGYGEANLLGMGFG